MHYLLPHLVDNSAERHPEHTAMVCRDRTLSFAQLARSANALARVLIEQGVRKGDRVGILMNKRVECAVAIHGIMKAGAIYVPLDPLAPPARHAFIVKDCGLEFIVSEPQRAKQLQKLAAQQVSMPRVVGVSDDAIATSCGVTWEALHDAACDSPPQTGTMEQDLCYILYTSGSTGVPKGIMHTHRSALAWAEVSAADHGIGHTDRISNYAPLHFDLSTLDFFAGALAGATTIMIPEEHTRLPMSLGALLESEALTLFYTVPFALIQLATSGALDGRNLQALRAVLFGGEPMPVKHLRHLMGLLPHTRFCNVYGPTEVNGCTRYFVPPLANDAAPLPIGGVYPNVEALVVDADDATVAVGGEGELLIRAPTMMRGYWNRPDLNATAFYTRERYLGVVERFHRTGDVVVREPDDSFRFVGRKDRQIKTRGCRVDLDDVEAALGACDGVDEAAVFPVRDAQGTLAVHAAARCAAQSERAALLKQLRMRLPAYALPVRLDVVKEFPRTSSGKIDRRVLRETAEQDALRSASSQA